MDDRRRKNYFGLFSLIPIALFVGFLIIVLKDKPFPLVFFVVFGVWLIAASIAVIIQLKSGYAFGQFWRETYARKDSPKLFWLRIFSSFLFVGGCVYGLYRTMRDAGFLNDSY